jgi:hypothetical protein
MTCWFTAGGYSATAAAAMAPGEQHAGQTAHDCKPSSPAAARTTETLHDQLQRLSIFLNDPSNPPFQLCMHPSSLQNSLASVSPPKALIMYRMSTISPPTEPECCSSPNCKHGKPNASEHEQHTLHMYQNYMINQFSPSIHPSIHPTPSSTAKIPQLLPDSFPPPNSRCKSKSHMYRSTKRKPWSDHV